MARTPSQGAVPLLVVLASSLPAQEPATPASRPSQAPATARPVVVTATKTSQDPFESPFATTLLGGGTILGQRGYRSTPETLREVPGVSVQKTAHGQGSPKFRGQTGFQTLLLVDGVRLNDAAWRSGNVEYWNHVDPWSMDRFEIVRGPGSVLWGSDANFGVGQVFTKGRTSFEPGLHFEHGLGFRYGSAEDSTTVHGETAGNLDEFGWHLGLTYKDYGDLTAGREIGLLPDTGYQDRDGDLKATWRISERERLSLAAQVVSLHDVPRTHSTTAAKSWRGTTVGTDQRREHDHRRQLYYLKYQADGLLGADSAEATAGYKDRYEREDRIPANGRQSLNVTSVETFFGVLGFTKRTDLGKLSFGGDFYHDAISSNSRDYNADGTPRSSSNRGPVAGDATYDLLGIYVQDEYDLTKNVTLTGGVRFTYAAIDAARVDVPGDSVVFDDVDDSWTSFTPSLRVVARPSDVVRVFGGYSQGFRTPNVSDFTRFDVARSGEQEVPAAGLEPETYDSFEVGVRYDDGRYAFGATPWYTFVHDQLGRVRTGGTVNGLPEVSKRNIGDGWLAGFELEGSASLHAVDLDEWSLFGFVDYVDGEITAISATGTTLYGEKASNLPPLTGLLGVRWEHPSRRTGAEVFSRAAYHKGPGSYSTADREDTQRIPPAGLPSYATVNLRGWHELSKNVRLGVAIENLNNVDYRVMGSGVNEPGTNVVVTLQARF